MGFGFIVFASLSLLIFIPALTRARNYEIGIFGIRAMSILMLGGLVLLFLGVLTLILLPLFTGASPNPAVTDSEN
jgi:hypothetical protein